MPPSYSWYSYISYSCPIYPIDSPNASNFLQVIIPIISCMAHVSTGEQVHQRICTEQYKNQYKGETLALASSVANKQTSIISLP